MPKAQFARDLRTAYPTMFPEMNVASANTCRGHMDQAFSCCGRWDRDFDDGELVGRVGCYGDVGGYESYGCRHCYGLIGGKIS
jgi:hypothetical protein